MTREQLIAALEVATEGSRELDGDIAELLQPEGLKKAQGAHLNTLKRNQVRKGYIPGDLGAWERSYPTSYCWPAPHYTTSIDAALTLVPEGWLTSMGNDLSKTWTVTLRTSDARFATHAGQGGEEIAQIAGKSASGIQKATPALALCIAALKTRTA